MKGLNAGVGELFLGFFFPPRCLLCGARIAPGEALCGACGKKLPEGPRERRFRLTAGNGEKFVVMAPFAYTGGCRENIHRMKFQGKKALARPFGRMMAAAAEGLGTFDGVAWVPLSPAGKKKRGYDQSQLLARSVAKALGLPLLPILRKVRDTAVQHELPRQERLANVKMAYEAGSGAAGKRVLLVDDIVTTGATMTECALALYRAGAKEVAGLCIADAPLKEDRL